MNVWISAITGVVVAVAAVVSTWILWKTFESVNAQTGISRNQFEMMLRNREEMSRPHLTVRVKFVPPRPLDTGTAGSLTVIVQNLGAIELRNLKISLTQENATTRPFGSGTRTIPPGASDEVKDFFHLAPQAVFATIQTKCEFETPTGKMFAQLDKWTIYHSPERENEHLESQLEEI
jgi:hypothetical protein